MLEELAIKGYRGIKNLTITGLTRVNLLVGKNNSGKTSVLECLEIFHSSIPVLAMARIAERRNEILDAGRDREFDLRHLFYGHELSDGGTISITDPSYPETELACEVHELRSATAQVIQSSSVDIDRNLDLDEKWLAPEERHEIPTFRLATKRLGIEESYPLSPRNGLPFRSSRALYVDQDVPPVVMLTTESLGQERLAQMWDSIALTPDEDRVLNALRILEPNVERIAFLSGRSQNRSPGIVVKLRDHKERVPLGSFGDGVRRVLDLAFAVVRSAGGVLLVDEIDTGLHYSVIVDMWRVLLLTAVELDVQIFATTHSLDCLEGLGALVETKPELASSVSVHRIERDNATAQTYTAHEIAQATRQDIEVR